MAVHQHPHLLDFSPPPNTVPMEALPPSFDHGHQLLALHSDGTDMPLGGVLADDSASWPQAAVSLSLFNYNSGGGSSLFSRQQPFAAPNNLPATTLQPFGLRSSKYLGPVKELLGEFCSLEAGDSHAMNDSAKRAPKAGKWDDVEALSSSSSSGGLWGNPSVSSMDLLELERRKARLLSMVEEVDRRYRRYREQMRAVEMSFEAVAGARAAQVYTRLALRAMSRHFRCLRDALVAQVRALRKAMGERDGGAAPAGATKGDTPRLKVLDQCLRQQRSFQQPGAAVENYPWRPQRGLPERAVAVLRAWLFEHFLHPYPNDVDKHILARQTGLSRSQVSNWFINARVRLWKPMIEDMYSEEVKQQQSDAANQNPSGTRGVVKPEKATTKPAAAIGGELSHFRTAAGNPSSMMIPSSIVVGDGDDHLFHGYPSMNNYNNGGGGAVSLTLGLQQQSFVSSMTHQRSLMTLQQGHEEQTDVLPYSMNLNLMGSQSLLHDFAG